MTSIRKVHDPAPSTNAIATQAKTATQANGAKFDIDMAANEFGGAG